MAAEVSGRGEHWHPCKGTFQLTWAPSQMPVPQLASPPPPDMSACNPVRSLPYLLCSWPRGGSRLAQQMHISHTFLGVTLRGGDQPQPGQQGRLQGRAVRPGGGGQTAGLEQL